MSEENEQETRGLPEDVHPGAVFKKGDIFGQYQIMGFLGIGGMGQVYEVQHQTLGTRHALKLINPELLELGDGLLKLFRKEAQVMAQLKHPGIVHVDDYGEEEGRVWLRQELVEGVQSKSGNRLVTLEEFIHHRGGRLPESEVRECMRQFLDALGFAHSKGCVHRDLKPGNILIDSKGMRITDFGLVRLMKDFTETGVFQSIISNRPDLSTHKDSRLALMGTYEYMSPEQKRGNADERSDLHSVGLICFRMLTGQKFLGATKPSELAEDINPDWDPWLLKAMAVEPENRFQTAAQMSDALPRLVPSTRLHSKSEVKPVPVETEPAGPPPESSGSRRGGLLFFMFLLLVLAGGFVYWNYFWKEEPEEVPEFVTGVFLKLKDFWNEMSGKATNPGPSDVEAGNQEVEPDPGRVGLTPAPVEPGNQDPAKGQLTAVSVEPPPLVSISPPTFIPPPAGFQLTGLQLDKNSLQENQPVGTLVGTLSMKGVGNQDAFVFELVGGDEAFFRIKGNRLETAAAINHESRPELKVQVRVTNGSKSSEETLDIVVENVNEAPVDLILDSNIIRENQPSGTRVGTLFARDPEGDKVSFSLPNARDVSLFRIDGTSLETRVALDFENPRTRDLKITIHVKDARGLGVDVVQAIQVKNVNERPSGLSIDRSVVFENLPPSTLVGRLVAKDPDAGDRHSFHIVEKEAGLHPFRIQSNQLLTLEKLDYEKKEGYLLPVRVTDRGGESKIDVLAIHVRNLIENVPARGEVLDYFFFRNQLWEKVQVIRNSEPYITLKLSSGEVVSLNYDQFRKHAGETNEALRKGMVPSTIPPLE